MYRLHTFSFLFFIILLAPEFLIAQEQPLTTKKDPRVERLVQRIIGVDTHNHVDVPLDSAGLPGPKVDLSGEMKKAGMDVIAMTFAVDYQNLTYEGQAYYRFLNGLTAMDTLLKNNHMVRALNYQDIEHAIQNHQPMVIQSVEGGHFLEGKIERLQVAYDRGLRHLGLLHDNDAAVPLGDIYTNPPRWGGLTDFGAQVIRECNRLGIVVDLTHCDNHTIDMALKVSTQPVIISHTGLDTRLGGNSNLANMMKPRLISSMEAKKVADAGGLIAVWTHLSDNPEEFAQNIKAMVDVVGINHVAIGTDTKLTQPFRPAFPGPQRENPKEERNEKQGSIENKNPQGPRVGERTNRVWAGQTEGFYYTVVDALLKEGFSEQDIEKICGGNYIQLFKTVSMGHYGDIHTTGN